MKSLQQNASTAGLTALLCVALFQPITGFARTYKGFSVGQYQGQAYNKTGNNYGKATLVIRSIAPNGSVQAYLRDSDGLEGAGTLTGAININGVLQLSGPMTSPSDKSVWQSAFMAIMQNGQIRMGNKLTLGNVVQEETATMAYASLTAPATINTTQPMHAQASNSTSSVAQTQKWKVGDKVIAGTAGAGIVPGTIVEISATGLYYRVHYESSTYPWNNGYGWYQLFDLHARNEQEKADAEAAKGPRLGKYLIYGYPTSVGVYNGYFVLQSGGTYEVFSPGGRSTGNGTYNFNGATKTVKWNSGPFTDKIWDGTQKLDVERDGKTHIIRLKRTTIGTNSTDSK